mgnify:CR=1 FL=1
MVMHSNPNSIKLKVTTTLYLTTNISTHTLHNLAFDEEVCFSIWGSKTHSSFKRDIGMIGLRVRHLKGGWHRRN